MSSPHENLDPRNLNAYLDGTLDEEARAQFARELAHDRQLQADVQLQEQIDASLRRILQPPAAPARYRIAQASERSDDQVPGTCTAPAPNAAVVSTAAAAMLAWAVVGWQFLAPGNRPPVYDPVKPLDVIYHARVAEGFKPTWVCEDDHVFASTFKERQGQGLLLAAMPQGSHMVGLAYFGGLSRYTTTMLAKVDSSPVMVFVDREENDLHPAQPDPSSGLHLFRKNIDGLVLYELTPLDKPHVMDYLYPADVPPRPPRQALVAKSATVQLDSPLSQAVMPGSRRVPTERRNHWARICRASLPTMSKQLIRRLHRRTQIRKTILARDDRGLQVIRIPSRVSSAKSAQSVDAFWPQGLRQHRLFRQPAYLIRYLSRHRARLY